MGLKTTDEECRGWELANDEIANMAEDALEAHRLHRELGLWISQYADEDTEIRRRLERILKGKP